MPTLVPVIITVDEHTPGEVGSDLYGGLFSQTSTENISLYQSTLRCALALAKPHHIITIAPFAYGSILHEQLEPSLEALKENILLEPFAHKTTSSITTAAYHALSRFDDPVLWILPIHQASFYTNIIKHAILYTARASLDHRFILYGIRAFTPDTRYAYIYNGAYSDEYDQLHHIRMFIPHPSKKSISSIWQQPYCMANSGMMLVKATHWINHMSHDVIETTYGAYKHRKRSHYGQLLNPILFNTLPKQSLSKFLGLLSQQKNHSLYSYSLPSDTSKQNGWYQIWQQSQITRQGLPLQKFLMQIR